MSSQAEERAISLGIKFTFWKNLSKYQNLNFTHAQQTLVYKLFSFNFSVHNRQVRLWSTIRSRDIATRSLDELVGVLAIYTEKQKKIIFSIKQLEGDSFQLEFVTLLAKHFHDTQRIPDQPQGDGGLDAYSHDATHAYCCYGPEISTEPNISKRELTKRIIEKFKKDLQRLFEIKVQGQGRNRKIVYNENKKLPTVLGQNGKKLISIKCVVSRLDDNTILGKLNDAFNEYKQVSKLQHIDPNCTLNVWGPEDVVTRLSIDDSDLLRLTQPKIASLLQELETGELPVPKESLTFEEKFETIKEQNPNQIEAIEALKAAMMVNWRKCLLFNERLQSDHPYIHQAFEKAVKDSALSANRTNISHSGNTVQAIEVFTQTFSDRTAKDLDIYFELVPKVPLSEMVTARLIGECPIGWKGRKND